jgi:hypothetical protein
MAPLIPTQVGDVLIVWTTHSFTIYAIGLVTTDGQQHFNGHMAVTHVRDRSAALAQAMTLRAPERRIFYVNIDTNTWSEIGRSVSSQAVA